VLSGGGAGTIVEPSSRVAHPRDDNPIRAPPPRRATRGGRRAARGARSSQRAAISARAQAPREPSSSTRT
jgi:hypothetical protein